MNIVDEVRKFVEGECKKANSKYGYEPYKYHFVYVVKYAKQLAEELDADVEIVEIAAWLHDIGSIMFGRKDHHITGAKIAEEKLREFNYPENKIEKVKQCIISHRGSTKIERKSMEAQIVADADTMSNFENLGGMYKAALVYEKMDQKDATKSVIEKLDNCWNKISPAAREMVRYKYEAATLLLK